MITNTVAEAIRAALLDIGALPRVEGVGVSFLAAKDGIVLRMTAFNLESFELLGLERHIHPQAFDDARLLRMEINTLKAELADTLAEKQTKPALTLVKNQGETP